ncbi:MAG: pyroglutamyl-peptidase I [Bacillota bacterium]|jgi:pyroglutamyl-peptidase|nr:pyroglutamyl-peptidase I [Bacillota bacterium]NLL26367.1 pyroglutamyl-peptidase I [Erysipelotrichia bacterium]
MNKKLLVTCFEPFNQKKVNSSFVAVEKLADKIGDYNLTKLTVPVVYGKAFETVHLKIEELKPDVILCVGQAGGRKNVTLEKIAINYRSATICDNEGNKYDGIKIDENGDDGIFVNLEVEKLAEISGCEVSLSAGSFVCNDLIYMIRNYYQDKVQAGFIHVPYLPEQTKGDSASLSLEEIVLKLTLIIENL